jgi:hypothetical protein
VLICGVNDDVEIRIGENDFLLSFEDEGSDNFIIFFKKFTAFGKFFVLDSGLFESAIVGIFREILDGVADVSTIKRYGKFLIIGDADDLCFVCEFLLY